MRIGSCPSATYVYANELVHPLAVPYHELRQLGLNFRVNDSSIVDRVFRRHLRASVEDADLRSRLTPEYPIGCKRILISNHWYKALVDPKVEVVDKGIAEILPKNL